MAVKKTSSSRLSQEQVTRVLELLKSSDSVELKVTVEESGHEATIKGLGIDPVDMEPRQVFFFDTPNLALDKGGLVVRARRVRGGSADTVIKLRPVVPADLPKSLRRSGAFKVEVDALPGGVTCSGSLKGQATAEDVRAAVAGEAPLRKLFSKEQQDFFRKYAPRGVTIDRLVPLGPTFVLRSRFYVGRLDRKVVAEIWLYPDGSRLLELSTKGEPAEALTLAARFRAYLAKHGVSTEGGQSAKTRTALSFFGAQLRRDRKASRRVAR
jgi:hypothetical protein